MIQLQNYTYLIVDIHSFLYKKKEEKSKKSNVVAFIHLTLNDSHLEEVIDIILKQNSCKDL